MRGPVYLVVAGATSVATAPWRLRRKPVPVATEVAPATTTRPGHRMTQLRLQRTDAGDFTFDEGIAAIRAELELPSAFPPEVEAAAALAAANPRLPELDRTDLPLFTLDPVGSMDLDQAMWLER